MTMNDSLRIKDPVAGTDVDLELAAGTGGRKRPVVHIDSGDGLPLPTNAAQETGGNLASLVTQIGAVTASPTANTLLARLKDLLTSIVLAAGANVIGKVRLVTASGDEITDDTVDAVNVRLRRVASGTYASAASVTSTATLIIAANANRIGVEVHHQGTATARVWLGADNTLTAGASGKNFGYLDPGDTWERHDYTGAVYGRAEAGTAYVSSLEV